MAQPRVKIASPTVRVSPSPIGTSATARSRDEPGRATFSPSPAATSIITVSPVPPAPTGAGAPSPTADGFASTGVSAAPAPRVVVADPPPAVVAMNAPATFAAPAARSPEAVAAARPGPVGGDPEPVVVIESTGRHKDAPPDVPLPELLQGTSYTARFKVTFPVPPVDPDGSSGDAPLFDYKLEKYVWTFPGGAVKGYGTFETQTGDPDGPHEVFTGGPTAQDGVPVRAETEFTNDDLDYDATQTDSNGNVLDVVISTFFVGPEMEGLQDVKVQVTFRKYSNGVKGGTVEKGDEVQFDALKPTGAIAVDHAGVAGVSPVLSRGSQYLQFAKDWDKPRYDLGTLTKYEVVNSPNIGIRWTATLTLPGGLVEGKFAVFQTISSQEAYDYIDQAAGNSAKTNEAIFPVLGDDGMPVLTNGIASGDPVVDALDNAIPYGLAYTTTDGKDHQESATAIPGQQLKGGDNPTSQLADAVRRFTLPVTHTRSDQFVTTLMYNPGREGDNADIWVPVAKLPWSWSGFAKYDSKATPKWSDSKVVAPVVPAASEPAQANGDFPTWTRNVLASGRYRTK